MNNKEREMQYLELYRRQLRRETKAMGYGQREVMQVDNHGYGSARPASRQIMPALLTFLGLFTRQIQPSR